MRKSSSERTKTVAAKKQRQRSLPQPKRKGSWQSTSISVKQDPNPLLRFYSDHKLPYTNCQLPNIITRPRHAKRFQSGKPTTPLLRHTSSNFETISKPHQGTHFERQT